MDQREGRRPQIQTSRREAANYHQGHEYGFNIYQTAGEFIPPEACEEFNRRIRPLSAEYDRTFRERLARRTSARRAG